MTGDCLVAGLSVPRRLGIVAPIPSRLVMPIMFAALRVETVIAPPRTRSPGFGCVATAGSSPRGSSVRHSAYIRHNDHIIVSVSREPALAQTAQEGLTGNMKCEMRRPMPFEPR